MLLGLGSRAFADSLPVFVANHFGDALWAAMIYLGVRTIWVHMSLMRAVLISAIFCYGIEFSQLYQADWINSIRRTLLGSLILGSSYVTIDLVRYTVGIGIAFLIDRYCSGKQQKTTRK
nr:DUF2809 domain-containing protein [Paenibacillus castaneae]